MSNQEIMLLNRIAKAVEGLGPGRRSVTIEVPPECVTVVPGRPGRFVGDEAADPAPELKAGQHIWFRNKGCGVQEGIVSKVRSRVVLIRGAHSWSGESWYDLEEIDVLEVA